MSIACSRRFTPICRTLQHVFDEMGLLRRIENYDNKAILEKPQAVFGVGKGVAHPPLC
jgi:hypothetical protein